MARLRGRRGVVARSLIAVVGQGLQLARAPHALRWRLETFGLYMPSLPESRPWWHVNRRAVFALVRQLPGYARWLGDLRALRRDGPAGWWQARAGTSLQDWEEWLRLGES